MNCALQPSAPAVADDAVVGSYAMGEGLAATLVNRNHALLKRAAGSRAYATLRGPSLIKSV